jgi:hypothetical protein
MDAPEAIAAASNAKKIVTSTFNIFRGSFFDDFSKILKTLNIFQNHMIAARKEVDEALTWLVNYYFEKFMGTVLRYDVTMLNIFFDPTNTESHNSKVISKAVFDNIAARMTKRTREELHSGFSQCDVYSLAAILEMSDNDFESILAENFHYKKNKLRFQEEVSLFKSHFKPSNIPRLLKLLESCYRSGLFLEYVWRLFEKEHLEIVTDFVWRMLFDTQRIENRCIGLTVSTTVQLEVAKEIAQRSLLKKSETKRGLVFKCLLFQDFDAGFLESDPDAREEVRKLTEIHQEVALLGIQEMAIANLVEKNSILIGFLGKIMISSDSSFREKMVDTAFNSPESVPTEDVMYLFFRYIPTEFRLEKMRMMQKAIRKFGDAILVCNYVKSYFTAEIYNPDLSVLERRFILNLLLETDIKDAMVNVMICMSERYPIELRFFEENFKGFCRKHPTFCLKIATYCLTKQARAEFLGQFCEALEREEFSIYWFPSISDDPVFLARVRKSIRDLLPRQQKPASVHWLGQFVARYGESCDLELGLTCVSPDEFIYGFLKSFNYTKFHLAEPIIAQIMDLCKKCILLAACPGRQAPLRVDDSKIEQYCSFVIRHAKDAAEIAAITEYVNKSAGYLLQLELKYSKYGSGNISDTEFKYFSRFGWESIRYRVIEMWPHLNEEGKRFLLKECPYCNIVADDPKNPEYIALMQKAWRKEDFLPGYQTYLSLNAVCVAKVKLTAHLFFVDDFEREIETAGYLGMLDLSLHGRTGSPPQIRE